MTMAMDAINSEYSNISKTKETNNNQMSTVTNQSNKTIRNSQDIIEKVKEDPGYQPTIAEKTVINAIESANKKLEGAKAEIKFSVHEQTKQIMVKVINKDTKEIIREIPPEKILDMVANMMEMAGIIVDEKR